MNALKSCGTINSVSVELKQMFQLMHCVLDTSRYVA